MSRFDRFKPPQRTDDRALPAATPSWRDRASAYRQLGSEVASSKVALARFAILLDATGSMEPLIADAKSTIREVVRRVRIEAQIPVEVQLFAFRDYDVHEVVEQSPLSNDAEVLEHWLNTLRAYGGGANPGEAIESALALVKKEGGFHAVLLAGDEPPNPHADLIALGKGNELTADTIAKALGEGHTPIHAFVVGNRADTAAAFKRLADISGGCYGRLDGSAEMIDLAVMAMLSRIRGAQGVKKYASQHRLSPNAEAFKVLLIGSSK